MVLVVNISNDLISFGIYSSNDFITSFCCKRSDGTTSDEYILFIESILRDRDIPFREITGCCIASVVPSSTFDLCSSLKQIFSVNPLLVEHGVKTGVNIRIDNHSQLGADLVANVSGCSSFYDPPYIIVDLGTATTISFVNERNEFIGVIIAPGVYISAKALSESAAYLPHISISAPKSLIGKNTVDSMVSGSVFGSACMIDGLVDKIKAEHSCPSAHLIACGNFASQIIPYCSNVFDIRHSLTLDGLNNIYNLNNNFNRK